MKLNISINQPNVRAKILGLILILFGISLFFIQGEIYIKISFSLILIGLLLIFLITEKTIPNIISKTQIEGNYNAIKKITENLNLNGNAIFLPKSDILNEERVFIPLENDNIKIPEIHDDFVFSTGMDGESLGISLPPSGLKLLEIVQKEIDIENIGEENIDEFLQIFIGLELVGSVKKIKKDNKWKLEIAKPIFCNKNLSMCKKYPCPVCSAILTGLTKALGKKIRIINVEFNKNKIIFYLKVGD